jgi:hypothetical protein
MYDDKLILEYENTILVFSEKRCNIQLPKLLHKIFTLGHLVNGIPSLCQNNLPTEMIKRSAEKFKIMQIF